jgi:hypothetical protein
MWLREERRDEEPYIGERGYLSSGTSAEIPIR